MADIDVADHTRSLTPNRRRADRALTILIALVVALADWVFCTAILQMKLLVDQGTGPMSVQPVLVAAAPILAGFTGWGLLALLERISPRNGNRAWTIIAIVVCVLSCYSPITMALSVSTAIALISMHILVGATLIIGLRRQ